MKTVFRLAWAALLVPALVAAACSGDNGDSNGSDRSYDEGSVRMEIETLDTGLLKGHSYVEAADGWAIEEVHVTAVAEKGESWVVIEIPEATDDAKSTLFFEVTIAELPRGDQVAITTVTKFKNDAGEEVERTAADNWPP